MATIIDKETYSIYSLYVVGADKRETQDKELHWIIDYTLIILFQFYKIEVLFIIIFYIIQHEEEHLYSSLSDDERKEGIKSDTNEETCPYSETYYHAAHRYGDAILHNLMDIYY